MTCVSVISNHMSQIIKSCNSTVITETLVTSGIPRNFFLGGVQQIQLTEDREDGDLGAVAP